jgi:hypothetical protein
LDHDSQVTLHGISVNRDCIYAYTGDEIIYGSALG